MSNRFVCPECGNDLSITATKDWSVNPETGVCECPIVDNFFHCSGCDWDSLEDPSDIQEEILSINLENNTL